MRFTRSISHALALAAILCAATAASDSSAPLKDKAGTKPEAATPGASATVSVAPAPPVTVGKSGTAKWTATTYEAAVSEANKKVLEGGKPATVTGEVVDVSCYLQLGKRGAAHVACGTKCITNGQPIGIVDDEDNLYILFAEEHHPRRDGEADLRKIMLPLLAKRVIVTGMMTEMKGYKALFVPAVASDNEEAPPPPPKDEKK
jgi:hypothetical protein